MEQTLVKIIIGLTSFMVFCGGFIGFFIVRLLRGYDEKFKDIYGKIEDLPAIREAIKWLERNDKK